MIKRIKIWLKALVVRRMFTPVRAYKLVKASVRVDSKPTSADLRIASFHHGGKRIIWSSLTVFYSGNSPVDSFAYRDQHDLAVSEFLFIHALVEAP